MRKPAIDPLRIGQYLLASRLDIHHEIMLLIAKNSIYRAPVKNPHRILDLGTGTGNFAPTSKSKMFFVLTAAQVSGALMRPTYTQRRRLLGRTSGMSIHATAMHLLTNLAAQFNRNGKLSVLSEVPHENEY